MGKPDGSGDKRTVSLLQALGGASAISQPEQQVVTSKQTYTTTTISTDGEHSGQHVALVTNPESSDEPNVRLPATQ